MKTIISAILFASLLLTSCNSNRSDEKSISATEQSAEEVEASGDLAKMNSCEEYLDQYEKWIVDYIVLVKKYMNNPMDSSLSQKFLEQAEEGTLWMTKWSDDLADCASQEKYQKRFDEISERAEKELEELGID